MSRGQLREYVKAQGAPCPLRELDPRNALALEVVRLLLNDSAAPIAGRRIRLLCAGMGRAAEEAVLDRALDALADPDVSAARRQD